MDYPKLAGNLTNQLSDAVITSTKYFTARISAPEDKRIRQHNYLEVLELRGNIEFYFGNYRDKSYACSGCNRPNSISNEKQTDVNIAVQMLVDAYEDAFDVAVIMSGDSDLVPPIKEIKRLFPAKKIYACFPPKRRSKEIRKICGGEIIIGEADLKIVYCQKLSLGVMGMNINVQIVGNKIAIKIKTIDLNFAKSTIYS